MPPLHIMRITISCKWLHLFYEVPYINSRIPLILNDEPSINSLNQMETQLDTCSFDSQCSQGMYQRHTSLSHSCGLERSCECILKSYLRCWAINVLSEV